MKEIVIKDKQLYLNKNYPFADTPIITDRQRCIHCNCVFIVGDYKVFKGRFRMEYICCPNAPDCSGTVIDWEDVDEK
jgi:hypothetical protein